MQLAKRLSKIEEPQTIKMAKLSRELKAQGKDIIDLSLGEPDFRTPQHIVEAAIQAMQDGFTKYPPVAGFPDLRLAITEKFKRDNHLEYTPDQVMVGTGAKQCLANAILSIIDDGDEVIIPAPFWVTYADLVKLADGIVVQVNGTFQHDFKISASELEQAITSKTKLFIFSSPCNPTGSIYSFEELKALAEVFERHPNIYIISDEIYEYINFEGPHESIAQFESIRDRVIIINGLSKGFAMTGWRLGYMAGPKNIITACEKIQSQFTSGPNSITQKAAVAALKGDMQPTLDMKESFRERRDYLVQALSNIPGLKVNMPPGAFYVFPDITHFLNKGDIQSAEDLCMYLLDKGGVSCVTGDAFGDPHCIRISYATSLDLLKEAVKRLEQAFAAIY
ncbi:MAG: pyridoxal phosphate-dependent aminotransferase [Bacteroidetes bacterium]|nr:pyridoxal phosphate-dependent aminotransferase [Bacteroidota bacterium]